MLLPLYGSLVPFHIGTIKNVTATPAESMTIIRISFNVPGQSFGGSGWPPAVANPEATFLREVPHPLV